MAKAKLPVPTPKGEMQLSSEWQKMLEASAVAAAAEEPAQGKWLSLKGGVMSFNGNALPNSKMSVIILDGIMEHQWYSKAFDPNSPASPDCYAFGRSLDTMKAQPQVEKPISPACPTCPKNAWGSDPKGGRGKACREVRRIALIDAAVLEAGPEGIMAAEIVLAKIPGMSVAPYADYVRQLANVMKMPPWGVVTDFSVRPDKKTMLMCGFQYVSGIPEDCGRALMQKRAMAESLLFAPYPPNAEDRDEQRPKQDQKY